MSASTFDPVATAIALARRAHERQLDKLGRPYIEHPLRVMESLPRDDVDGRVVAVLHDVVEDTTVTLDQLCCLGFSGEVLCAIACLTHEAGEPYESYLLRVRENPLALRVKLADMADNASEERLSLLPEDVAARLRVKYARARALLGQP